ncbi:prepilin-type N-terminal cleavage/methylation domain-containing protein, partial [Salmonella enterica]
MFFRTAIRSTRVPQPRQGWSGFTLSELLVCLLILGEISAMTIPKV